MTNPEGPADVVFHADGTATLVDPVDGDWHVHQDAEGFWTADNPVQGHLHSTINAAFPATFDTRDEVFAALGVQVPA